MSPAPCPATAGAARIARARLESGQVKMVTISPITSAAVRELGMPVAAEAKEYTEEGLVEALVGLRTR